MNYRSQKSMKNPHVLTPEECEVRDALTFYTDDDTKADPQDFVATRVLYETYCEWKRNNRTPLEVLTPRYFGAALRRVFPWLGESGSGRRVRRTYENGVEWGYWGMKGPRSVRSASGPGRPNAAGGS